MSLRPLFYVIVEHFGIYLVGMWGWLCVTRARGWTALSSQLLPRWTTTLNSYWWLLV